MAATKFDEIIDFAIEREREAIDFYEKLMQNTQFAAQKKLLKDFSNMEKGHIEILKQLKKKSIAEISKIKEIQDLALCDYLVSVEPYQNMTFQDILIIAMKKEESAVKLYTYLASAMPDENSKILFSRIANEEKGHKNQFEILYDDKILIEN